jgi:VIT1/CCC1 family predicted Fe2+/Mn2+ transporter
MRYQEIFKDVARASCIDEYRDYMIYRALSESRFVSENMRRKLEEMADQEKRHHDFWKRYTDKCEINSLRLSIEILLIKILMIIMGVTFVIKFFERHEKEVIKIYRRYIDHIDESDREYYNKMISEEEAHEDSLVNQLEEGRIKYLGFTVLGLSDALIEIAGIHAGTLGVYSDTVKAGLAGLVAGVAASIAMASAAYAQAKQLTGVGRPSTAALYTGIAYLFTAFVLALPYFLIHDILIALLISLGLSILILAYISLYSMVLFEKSFSKELGETTLIIFGATITLYLFGEFVRRFLGLQI